jgi:2',3'-cyclic-nucleotide 2'-phosphodiesterase (5'-nucleotidase family)/predicted AlkP superfamily phosphohydrolase/phosphomutase
MKRRMRRLAPALLGLATVGVVVMLGASAAVAKKGDGRPVDRVVMFASDGMRPDLMEKYAKAGYMPTYKALMKKGATGDNGMLQAFPPNTGVGWYTMATGTYPAEHGSTNNTFFRAGDLFSNRTSFSAVDAAGKTVVLQADTIANAAERAGKKVAQIDWVGGAAANIDGPTVDFANFFSNRGVLVGAADATEQAGSAFFGVTYQVASVAAASGWSNVPTGDPAAQPKETTWTINSSSAAQNPNRTYNVYFYDSVTGGGVKYDHAIVSPVGKTGAAPSLDLKVGDFLPLKLTGANGLIGTRAGQTVAHYIKLISLAPDLSNFKLYDTSLARAIAKCGTPCNGLPTGGAGEDRLEKYIADNLLPWAAADFAPQEAGVVDEETYMEQGRDLERAYSHQVIEFILHTLQPDTDLAMIGYPFTDEVQHQFMALVSPTGSDGEPNPCYDVTPKFSDTQCTGRGTAGRVAIREGFIRSSYVDADDKLKLSRDLMGGNPTTFAGSDHGFAPQWYAVNANAVLNQATVGGVSLHASGGGASNCSAVGGGPVSPPTAPNAADDITKACWAGGTIQIYVNPNRLKNAAQPTSSGFPTYEEVRTAVRNAFQTLTDPANPGKQVVDRIMNKEELRNVDGSDSLHPNRSGDVVVVLRPPYQSDAGTAGQKIALSHFFGQHGYLPDLVDLKNNINMHATFVMGGPGIEKDKKVKGVRAIDIAPTLAFLMDIPGPQNARGRILYDVVEHAKDLQEVTILAISDYHGQLIPLTEAADNLTATGTVNSAFTIGGAAFLKKWFEVYESEALLSDKHAGVIEMAAGDSVGATPPISNFFGDTPTIDVMNLMGIDVDGLGNHNFDRGQQYLRETLISRAEYPFVSANVVDDNGNTPAEWSPSHVFKFAHGVKVGIVGFSNDDLPTLINPAGLLPFHVANSTAAVNAEAAELAKKVDAIVAIGHLGADSGTVTEPVGPLVALADAVGANVDAVIGDHTNFQVLTTRPNGVLLTENLSKGVRFTRVRLVIGPGKEGVVYKTADFHKPWNVGFAPDAAIQAKIDALNADLTPILGVVLGESTKAIPRTDQCGNSNGRLCESLVGNVVADALLDKYGTDFALTNSGGLRAALTCPAAGGAGAGFCPAGSTPPFPITLGGVYGVLPFGNFAVTIDVTGAELKTMLERGVSAMPGADGRFPQVAGLCFTYDIALPAGSRVTGAVRANADGSCTATPVDLTAGTTYALATNDFTASGGDGYPNFKGRFESEGVLLATDVADYVDASSPLTPVVRAAPAGRINCTDGNGATAPNCPTLTASP